MEAEKRIENDSLGEVKIPAYAAWGPQTQRAIENFQFSGYTMPESLRRSIGLLKAGAAATNFRLQRLDTARAKSIENTSLEIWNGGHVDSFPVEVFQTGSGTSWNMNANEVIARLSSSQNRQKVHPNDHVNLGQSSNDVIPTAINISSLLELHALLPEIEQLRKIVQEKAREFHPVIKLGRTHLQDAVPVRLSDCFFAVDEQLRQSVSALQSCTEILQHVALGGTATGTGLNTHADFSRLTCEYISASLGCSMYPAASFAAEMNCRLPQTQLMGAMQLLLVTLQRWCIDLRLLSSGPNGGLGEINLPELQPGSSIMPGKVNPVIPEAVQQLTVHLLGKCPVVANAAAQGPLELNIMFPLIAYETLETLRLARNACRILGERCIRGITANADICRKHVEGSLALITKVAEDIGYDKAAKIAQKAQREKRTLRDVLISDEGFSNVDCDKVLDPESMIPK